MYDMIRYVYTVKGSLRSPLDNKSGAKDNLALSAHFLSHVINRRDFVQSGAAYHSQGFEDDNLGSSPGLLGQSVATVAAHQPGELPKFSSSKPSE